MTHMFKFSNFNNNWKKKKKKNLENTKVKYRKFCANKLVKVIKYL